MPGFLITRTMLDTSCVGSSVMKTIEFKWDLLERIKRNSEDWDLDEGKESGITPKFDCVKYFMNSNVFREFSTTYGLDSEIVASFCESFATHVDLPKEKWFKYNPPIEVKVAAPIKVEEKTITYNDPIVPTAYVEKPPFPVRIKDHAKASIVVRKSNIITYTPLEKVKVEPNIAIVKDLLSDNIDGHVIHFCGETARIAKPCAKDKHRPVVGVPVISVKIGDHCYHGLCDMGASASVIPHTLYEEIKHEIAPAELEGIDVTIKLCNRDTISPIGIVRVVEVLCGKTKYPADFLVLSSPQDSFCPIIFGRPFLNTVNARIDCEKNVVTIGLDDMVHEFNFYKFSKQHREEELPSKDEIIGLASIAVPPSDPLEQYLLDHENDMFTNERREIDELFFKQEPILKHNLPVEILGDPPPPKGDPVFDLKPLSDNLNYVYLDENKIYPIIISANLSEHEEERLLKTLKKHRAAIGYTLDDLKGISPTLCQHKINLEADAKPVRDPQRRLNPKMKEVVRKEILKLLEAGIIYPVADSQWVSPVHCVPKKGGITVLPNDKDELIPQRIITGYRMLIDFRKLNKATKKDHYPLPFIDQMLERLCKHTHFCFLDGYSGFSQIPVSANDQSKTTFTCPFGTFAYRRMPFGLCNAPATFQRCMMAIFSDFCEKICEVFMDDFSVYGSSFDDCLSNLDRVLQRCDETNLVLNWEKCHFMVNEGIVLGHKVFERGIEVDKTKVDAIEKMPCPKDIKGIRSFLGHAGFYRRFIKDFSKISGLLLTFCKRMFHLFLMMIVK